MGCTCIGGSQVEQFLTDFIEELKIRTFTDRKFTDFLELNNPFIPNETKTPGFLVSTQRNNEPEHKKYSENLQTQPRHYLALALLFLTKSSAKSLSGQYLTIVDRLKNKCNETFNTRLEDFYKTDYELMKTALIFYCKMISYDVVEACANVSQPKLTYDQANQLKSIYSGAVIENFVNDLFKERNTTANLDHDDFFQRNHQNLEHHYVRERLRAIWTSKFSPSIQKEFSGATREGKIYTLNNNAELEKQKVNAAVVQADQTVNELVSAGAPVFRGSSTTAQANPMNSTVYIPSQQQTSATRRTIDLTNEGSLGLVSSGNRVVAAPQNQYTSTTTQLVDQNKYSYDLNSQSNLSSQYYSQQQTKYSVSDSATKYYQNGYSTSLASNNVNNLINQQTRVVQETQLISDLPSLVSSGKPVENTGAYIDPYNNATNKFLYGKEKIDSADVKNLPTKLFMTLKQFRRECLSLHNETRKLHQASELVEDPSLTERAQQWANSVAELDTLNHSNLTWDGKTVGENIAKGSAVLEEPAKLVCGKWYSEINNYSFTSPGAQPNTKNFTQMIWKDSRLIGMGLAYSKSGSTYVVVNYFPAGNDETTLAFNVLPAEKTN